MSVRKTILAVAAVSAALVNVGIAAAPAMAQAPETIAVSFADLNLGNQAGRDALDRRIESAANQLCGHFNPVELGQAQAGRACLTETIAAVQPQREAALNQRFGTVEISQLNVSVSRAAN